MPGRLKQAPGTVRPVPRGRYDSEKEIRKGARGRIRREHLEVRLGLAVPARLEQAHGEVLSRSHKRGIEFKRSLEKALGAVEVPRADQRSSERVQDQCVIGQDA